MTTRSHRRERGQATVEMALVMPILLLILLGIVQLGLIFHAQLTLDTAAREGARRGAVGAGDAAIRDRVARVSGFDPAALQITVTPAEPRQSGDELTINVSYPVRIIVPMMESLLGGSGGTLPISATASMRVE